MAGLLTRAPGGAALSERGQRANQHGAWFRSDVQHLLVTRMGYEQRRTAPTKPLPHGWFLTGWRGGYRDIVGMPMRHDFFVVDPQRCPNGLILEATFQSSTGSTDKKLVFTVLSLKPLPHRIILFLDGKGFKPAYVDWCLAQQEPGHLDVYTDWDAFRATLNEGIL